jgi:hypothetical protein
MRIANAPIVRIILVFKGLLLFASRAGIPRAHCASSVMNTNMLTVNLKKLSVGCSNFAFLLLFPGFFYYHSMLGLGMIPPFLGGYFGVVAVVLFPLVFASFIYLNKTKFIGIDIAFIAIVILTISISIFNYALGIPQNFTSDKLEWSLSGLLFNLVAYCLARTISIDSRLFTYMAIASLVSMALIVFYNIDDLHGIFNLKAVIDETEGEFVATYQGFARSLAVVGLLSVSMLDSKKQALAVFLLTLCALFFNGARTEFALFFVVYISLLVFMSTSVIRSFLVLILLMMVMTIFVLNLEALMALLPENRMLQLLHIGSSSSAQSRDYIEQFSWGLLANNPVLGDYGGYTEYRGDIHDYSHNLLSAWVNLGLVGFGLYILVILVVVNGILRIFFKMNNKTTEERIMFAFSMFAILALVFSKDYSSMFFGLMVGFYSRYQHAVLSR